MTPGLLNVLWVWFDSPEPVITIDRLNAAGPAVRSWLERLNLLRPTTGADLVICPECDERHVEPVERRTAPDGRKRLYIACPESLRVEIAPERLRQWVLDTDVLAGLIAGAMTLRGAVTPLLPGRLWRLGKADHGKTTREVLLARGLHWEDGDAIVPRCKAGRPIVFTGDAGGSALPSAAGPTFIALSRIATAAPCGIELDLPHLWTLVQDHDAQHTLARNLAEEDLDRRIERSMLRVARTRMEDDVLLAAYRQYGSLDKATAALRAAGHDVNRDQIYRAVHRAGGVRAVIPTHSSESVHRVVASQHRNRAKKKSPPR